LRGLHRITQSRGPYPPGQAIFRIEDCFGALFVIQKGTVKIETTSRDGTHLVDGFFFRGDMLGLEAIGDDRYRHDAVALEPTWICELPYDQLESLCSFVPRLQHRILLLAQKIRHTTHTIMHGRYLSAEQRVLQFLRMLCQKQIIQQRDNQGSLLIPMSKGDIASYLGLRPESLSRALSKLQEAGLIRNHGREIEFPDLIAIRRTICD